MTYESHNVPFVNDKWVTYSVCSDAFVDTRFCFFNTAFFDLDQDSSAELGPPFDENKLPHGLDDSINMVSIRVLEFDLGFSISVFGIVIVRDQVDFRCVYVFHRDRNNCQLITSPDDTLTLTGPYQEPACTDHLFFEIKLKVRVSDGQDADADAEALQLAKHPGARVTPPSNLPLVASIEVNDLMKHDEFIGSVTAWTVPVMEEMVLRGLCGVVTGSLWLRKL